uniref:Uncharacterized protein n=1 Tax=Wolbachia endosymbiont of Oeneis ivallda TaxID=3171168 RepID=A0AAU7YMJ9_9RICK
MGIQAALEKALISTKVALISGRVNRIVKDGLKDAYSAMPSANSIKEIFDSAYDTSVEYTKSGLTSVGTVLQSVCDVIAHPTANLRYFQSFTDKS